MRYEKKGVLPFEEKIKQLSADYIYEQAVGSLLLMLMSAMEDVEKGDAPLPYTIHEDLLAIKKDIRSYLLSLEDLLEGEQEDRAAALEACIARKEELLSIYETVYSYFSQWNLYSTLVSDQVALRKYKEEGIEVLYQDETLWLTQKTMSILFDVDIRTINEHLKNIYSQGEVDKNTTIRKNRIVQKEGNRNISREVFIYSLDAIISVGYRVNSVRATQFRQWCTFILRQFAIRGYVIDKKRMENGSFINEDYFEHLLAEIREIRLSERRFYQKLTDIYATSIDYNLNAPTTRLFFKKVQNKMHYAVHGHTAAELIVERADAEKEHMGLTTWEKAPNGKIVKTDVSIAKNYLKEEELESMGRLVNAFLDLAEDRAKRHIPMTMEDWAKRIDKFLDSDDRPILNDSGKMSAEQAKDYAETEFEKYRIFQDRVFQSDFDKLNTTRSNTK